MSNSVDGSHLQQNHKRLISPNFISGQPLRARNIGLTSEPRLALPLSQLLLADSLGMTPVHLNRVLKELRLSGAMSLERGNLLVADPTMLVRIAGFDENYLHRRLRRAA